GSFRGGRRHRRKRRERRYCNAGYHARHVGARLRGGGTRRTPAGAGGLHSNGGAQRVRARPPPLERRQRDGTLSPGGFCLAAVWLHTGRGLGVRLPAAVAVALTLAAVIWTGARFRQSWDLSEDRRNSFSPSDEAALSQIREPLRVTVFLAAEDPRLM